jgi:hypothetical protein
LQSNFSASNPVYCTAFPACSLPRIALHFHQERKFGKAALETDGPVDGDSLLLHSPRGSRQAMAMIRRTQTSAARRRKIKWKRFESFLEEEKMSRRLTDVARPPSEQQHRRSVFF